jgi:hypothetical protein
MRQDYIVIHTKTYLVGESKKTDIMYNRYNRLVLHWDCWRDLGNGVAENERLDERGHHSELPSQSRALARPKCVEAS